MTGQTHHLKSNMTPGPVLVENRDGLRPAPSGTAFEPRLNECGVPVESRVYDETRDSKVVEKPYQCQNRIGTLEGLSKLVIRNFADSTIF
jgi:hypothetical protein